MGEFDDALARIGGFEPSPFIARELGDSDALAISKDGKFLASAGVNNRVRIFDASSGKEIQPGRGHGAGVTGLALAGILGELG